MSAQTSITFLKGPTSADIGPDWAMVPPMRIASGAFGCAWAAAVSSHTRLLVRTPLARMALMPRRIGTPFLNNSSMQSGEQREAFDRIGLYQRWAIRSR